MLARPIRQQEISSMQAAVITSPDDRESVGALAELFADELDALVDPEEPVAA